MSEWRSVDMDHDRDLLLELHCSINYESETPLARKVPYEAYREKWLSTSQTERFLSELEESLKDERTVAEILEEDGEIVAYVWVMFWDVEGYDVTVAEIVDVFVASERRRQGIGSDIMSRIEETARKLGASLLRSDTGIENVASQNLHEKMGYAPYKIHYEKALGEPLE